MNIYTLNALIAVLALVVTIAFGLMKKPENWLLYYVRNFLGTFFIFSGVVKAIDPLGTAFKMEDYFNVFTKYTPFLEPFWDFWVSLALPVSVFMVVLEIVLGIALILGTLPKITLALYVGLIAFFLFLTGFTAYTGEVTDCGCFGDFLKLEPFVSFLKDVFLSILLALVIFFHQQIKLIFDKKVAFISLAILTIVTTAFSLRNCYDLPVVDFRAYHVGQNLIKGKSSEGLDPGETLTYYTLVKEGETPKRVDSKTYMDKRMWEDKSWTIDKEKTESEVIRPAELPKIKDFLLFDKNDTDQADSLLAINGYHFFVSTYYPDKSSLEGFQRINKLMAEAKKGGVSAVGITSGDLVQAEKWANNQYEFYNLDATPIKTMMRSNPGVVLLKNDKIVGKYHHNNLPTWAEIKKDLKIK